jgi:hypothetical protein
VYPFRYARGAVTRPGSRCPCGKASGWAVAPVGGRTARRGSPRIAAHSPTALPPKPWFGVFNYSRRCISSHRRAPPCTNIPSRWLRPTPGQQSAVLEHKGLQDRLPLPPEMRIVLPAFPSRPSQGRRLRAPLRCSPSPILRRLSSTSQSRAALNRATQRWYTGSTRKHVIAVCPGHQVYESRVE